MILLDTHYHLDFITDIAVRRETLAHLSSHSVRVVAQTLTPSACAELEAFSVPSPHMFSLGYHPWVVSSTDTDTQLRLFEALIEHTRFIGEVGLDASPRHQGDLGRQVDVFERLVSTVIDASDDRDAREPYVMSIHAVRSVSLVCDILQRHNLAQSHVLPVFHRFSGTSDELTRLMRLGGYLSIHPSLLATKRGRAYIRQVPAGRLLLESDEPTQPVNSAGITEYSDPTEKGRILAEKLEKILHTTVSDVTSLRENFPAELEAAQDTLYQVHTPC